MAATGSLCPTIKASEILGDKWTLLILRELFFGATRYNQFQRALPRISPTVLSGRLKQMEKNGLIVHRKPSTAKTGEYRLTPSAKELAPIVDSLARWGLRWSREQLCDADLDAGMFMWDFHRTINTVELVDGKSIFHFILKDHADEGNWWIVADDGRIDLCNEDPGYEVDLYLSSSLECLAAVWMGDISVQSAIQNKDLLVTGDPRLARSISRWFPQSAYTDVRPQNDINAG